MARSEGEKRQSASSTARAWFGGVAMVVLGAITVSLAEPAAAGGSYLVEGLGSIKCSDFTSDEDENGATFKEDQQWIVGFVTGYNKAMLDSNKDANLGTNTNVDATMKLMGNYCTRYPDDELTDAAAALMKYFKGGGK